MKILWFTNVPVSLEQYYGITNKSGFWLSSLANYLKEEVELHIAFYYSKHRGSFENNGIHYHPIRYKKYWRIAIKNRFNISSVDCDDVQNYLCIINEVKPDLIHIHGTENIFTCLMSKTETPIVVSIQGILSTISKRMYDGLDEESFMNCQKYLYKLADIITFSRFNMSTESIIKGGLRERKNLHFCKSIIGRTDWDRRTASVIAPNARYYHIDEIMRPEFFNLKWSKPPLIGCYSVFSIASGAPYKGFELICETLAELILLAPEIEWQVAGVKDSDKVVSIVKNKMREKYPKKNLKLLGYLPTNSVIDAMLKSDLYVMPSHIENGCNALSEAMLIGMPCISCFSGGVGTTLTNNYDGILLQCGDSFALAGAILELKRDPGKAAQFGDRARIKACQRHNPNFILKETLKVYKEILTS